MEKSPSEEPHSSSASRQFPCSLWDMNVHYHVNNSPTGALILSQMNLVHATSHAIYLSSISILFPRLFLDLPICLFFASISTKPCTPYPFLSPMPHVHPNHCSPTPQYNEQCCHYRPNYTVSQQKFIPKRPQITIQQYPQTCCDRRWAGLSW